MSSIPLQLPPITERAFRKVRLELVSARRGPDLAGDDMSRILVCLAALALVCLGPATVRAEDAPEASIPARWLQIAGVGPLDSRGQPPSPDVMGGKPPTINGTMPLTSTKPEGPEHGLSQWIVGTDPSCCGDLGDHNPLQ